MNTSQTLRPEERRAASDPSMTGSKALIESFLQEGVETVFGYPGGAIIPVYDALYDYPHPPRRRRAPNGLSRPAAGAPQKLLPLVRECLGLSALSPLLERELEATGQQKLLREYGVRLVYVTMGPRGCYFANHSGSGTTACPTGIHVLDTTGAGDIFGGSAMSRLLKLDKAPEALSAEEMSAITRFACCAASLSTRHHGGINSIPEEQEVLELMRQG